MLLSTPPPSPTRKRRPARNDVFTDNSRKLQYYEDIHSKRNPEEFREGRAELCESESDSEDEAKTSVRSKKVTEKKGVSPGFMKRFSMPKGTSQLVDSDSSAVGETRSRQGQGIFNFLDEGPVRFPIHRHEAVGGFRGDATIRETPSPAKKPTKKLMPKRLGFFGGPSAFLLPKPQQNSAKAAMDDLLGPADTDVEEDSFTMVGTDMPPNAIDGKRAGAASKELQKVINKSGDDVDAAGDREAINPALPGQLQEPFDADGDTEFDEFQSTILAMRSRKASANDKRKRTRKSNLAMPPVRASARLHKNVGVVTKGTKKSGSRQTIAGRGKKGLAKTVKFETVRKNKVAQRCTKSGLRRRNWKGELMGVGPVVLGYADEVEDVDEFVRCFREY